MNESRAMPSAEAPSRVGVRVVYVIGSLGRGGAELQLLMLMRGLQGSEFSPVLFSLEAFGPLRAEVAAAGIPIVDGGYDSRTSRARRVVQLLRAYWRLIRLLRSSRPAVIHGFLPLANTLAALAGRMCAIPLVVTSRRALNTHQERVRGWRHADRLSTRLSHRVTANAAAVRDDTIRREGADASKFVVIHNGLAFERFAPGAVDRESVRRALGLEPGAIAIIVVANLIAYKGHADVLDALGSLHRRYPALRLLLAGDDRGIGAALRSRARERGVEALVRWLGPRSDVPELLAAADLYVSASHEEGFSNSLLEAMAAGKAVVATSVGGNVEMLGGGELGVLVPPRDSAALAEGIDSLLRDPELRSRLGALASAEVARRYAPARMIERHLAIYREYLGGERAAAAENEVGAGFDPGRPRSRRI